MTQNELLWKWHYTNNCEAVNNGTSKSSQTLFPCKLQGFFYGLSWKTPQETDPFLLAGRSASVLSALPTQCPLYHRWARSRALSTWDWGRRHQTWTEKTTSWFTTLERFRPWNGRINLTLAYFHLWHFDLTIQWVFYVETLNKVTCIQILFVHFGILPL